jgi:hypothetical protein
MGWLSKLEGLVKNGRGGDSSQWSDSRAQAVENAANRAPGGLLSSAGWADDGPIKGLAYSPNGPYTPIYDAWQKKEDAYQEKMDSEDTKNYLFNQSVKMGDHEFVGDLVDHLTSNRYYSNEHSEALAGAPEDLGPAAGGAWDNPKRGEDPRDKFATMYGGLVSPDTWLDKDLGGKYGGATGYNDPKFGLVKLGLYGTQGPSTSQDAYAAGKIWDVLRELGWDGNETSKVLEDLREGSLEPGFLDALEHKMGEGYAGSLPGSTQSQEWDDREMEDAPPGVFFSDRPGWTGNFKYDTKTTEREDIFGKYSPFSDTITVSPDDKNVRETLVHELGHRGMSGLSRLPPGLVSSALEEEYGQGAGGETAFIDPTTGNHMTTSEFLDYDSRWPDKGAGEVQTDAYGQSPEHNLIDASSRNRNNRYMFESFGTDDHSPDAEGRKDAQGTYGILGRVANNVLDRLQAGKAREVETMRTVGPQWYGGVTGTESSPLIPRR